MRWCPYYPPHAKAPATAGVYVAEYTPVEELVTLGVAVVPSGNVMVSTTAVALAQSPGGVLDIHRQGHNVAQIKHTLPLRVVVRFTVLAHRHARRARVPSNRYWLARRPRL